MLQLNATEQYYKLSLTILVQIFVRYLVQFLGFFLEQLEQIFFLQTVLVSFRVTVPSHPNF